MRNDIIPNLFWKEKNFVIEIQIFLFRTASPTSFLFLYIDFIKFEIIDFAKVRYSFLNEEKALFFVFWIIAMAMPSDV